MVKHFFSIYGLGVLKIYVTQVEYVFLYLIVSMSFCVFICVSTLKQMKYDGDLKFGTETPLDNI